MNKVYPSAAAALEGLLHDGMLIASGGFGLCGIPELLIAAIREAGGPPVEKRAIGLPGHIKNVGPVKATVVLHPEVTAVLTVIVVAA